jgi:hypothetical protein
MIFFNGPSRATMAPGMKTATVVALFAALFAAACRSPDTPQALPPIEALRARYLAATTFEERRTVALQAIDDGHIGWPGQISAVSRIFAFDLNRGNTRIAQDPWEPRERPDIRWHLVNMTAPSSDDRRDRRSRWYLVVRNWTGSADVGWYSFCNCLTPPARGLWHGSEVWDLDTDRRRRLDEYVASPVRVELIQELSAEIEDLRRLYWKARSERLRRDVVLKALDDGLIAEGMPVSVFDRLFRDTCDVSREPGRPGWCFVDLMALDGSRAGI